VEKEAQNFFRHPLHTIVKLFLKIGTAFLIGPAENCCGKFGNLAYLLQCNFLIQKLFLASD